MSKANLTPGSYIPRGWQDFTFLPDKHNDQLMHAMLSLAAEHWTVRRRLKTIEHVLAAKGLVSEAEIEQYVRSDEQNALEEKERDQFISRVFDIFTQNGVPAEY